MAAQREMFEGDAMPAPVMSLSELEEGQEADFFALLSEKQELTTRDGKPYFRVLFRDSKREVGLPIWADSPLANSCRTEWAVGEFYKLRAKVQQTNFGPQLEIRRIRPVADADAKDGFDPLMCLPVSRFDPDQMFAELVATAKEQIQDEPLRRLVLDIYDANRPALLTLPAARKNHHACVSGFLEHTLNVTRTCVHLADKYCELYPDMQPPLDKDLVIAGGMLHDIGKLRELRTSAAGTEYSAAGELIGHVLQGRDIVRETAAGRAIDAEKLLRLEHVIVAHQRLPEWGAPKPPMTPEALIVHHADDLDAKLNMIVAVLAEEKNGGVVTSKRNPMSQSFYRGGE
ncbi:MAG: 3'-5' exoribonuclease YhaM family protein [Pirellulales bacterium]